MAYDYPLYAPARLPATEGCAAVAGWTYPKATPASYRKEDDLCSILGIEEGWQTERHPFRSDDPAQLVLGEKAELGKMGVGVLVYQIRQRERIKDENLRRILYQEVAVGGQIERLKGMWPDDPTSGNGRLKAGLEMELMRLEGQKRAEEVDCWRDISRLKDRLLDRLIEYRDAARRHEMVGSGLGAYTVTGVFDNDGDR